MQIGMLCRKVLIGSPTVLPPLRGPVPRTGSEGVRDAVGRALTDPNLYVPIWTAKGWMEAEIRGEKLLNCRLTTITAEM